ncbi:MAG: bifunctional folylpolyglutamate synthase/dihydrofolate synthase [Bacteroidales bacterium]|nr:bifunctional folylpolyglutamate synthase/dihydrofolate synthase [Bacteroidales bacterium]
MTYEEKIEKLFSRTPSFQNVGAAAYKPGLETMREFDALLGHPARSLRCIHVAGTNGKGSVSSFLAAALSGGSDTGDSCRAGGGDCSGGRRVGLYTSPHLTDFRERIKIVSEDGFDMIPREAVEEFLDRYDDFIETHRPSFFEITTAMAFWYFAATGVDLAVIECGLGGRLDSTNIITPLVSVITNIGLEHTAFLGDTLEKIAFEKAGIIKPGRPVVVGEINAATRPVFEQAATERGCEIVFAPELNFHLNCEGMDLAGGYQEQNLATVTAALDILRTEYGLTAETSRISRAAALTGLRGRWEKLAEKPDIICDIGHNAHGLRRVFEQLRTVAPQYHHVYIIFGVVSDKDVDAIATFMIKPTVKEAQPGICSQPGPGDGTNVSYILTQPSNQRAMPVDQLAARLAPYGIPGRQMPTVAGAVALARKEAAAEDLIFIGGSNFTVSDAVALFKSCQD